MRSLCQLQVLVAGEARFESDLDPLSFKTLLFPVSMLHWCLHGEGVLQGGAVCYLMSCWVSSRHRDYLISAPTFMHKKIY